MNPTPTMPELTAFDVVTQLIAAAIYLAIGAAALAQAPRDERTRVFSGLGVMYAIGFCIPALAFFLGVKDPLAFGRVPLGVMLAALSLAAILMFHFSQVFPARRPWIRGAGVQLPVAYAVAPLAVFLLVRWWPWPQTAEHITLKFNLVLVVFGFPLMVLLGLVLPVTSIVSFLRSLRETQGGSTRISMAAGPQPNPQPAIVGILLSQIAGGGLSLLVLGPLHTLAPESFTVTIVAVTVWLLGLLTPLAYAAGVWKYDVLSIGQPQSAEVEPD
ncbi:MAG: hypothetical protein H0W08_10295 [Acidobacteria bacterium]|nr:hypothetical protein [Acidobacteriota bacterium]